MVRARGLLFTTVAVLWLVAVPAWAGEHVTELWRSRYGGISSYPNPRQVAAANPADGTVWLVEGANVTHLSADGTLLFRSEPLYAPSALGVDPANGSCWVLQGLSDQLLHFAADGARLSATPGHDAYEGSLTASPADGSVWVAGYDYVAHVDATGRETWRANWRSFPVVVDPNDGSAWLGDLSTQVVVRLRADGSQIWRHAIGGFAADEDVRDQSVWIAAGLPGLSNPDPPLVHISASGAVLGHAGGAALISGRLSGWAGATLYVSPLDGSIWVWSHWGPHGEISPGSDVYHFDSSGALLWQAPYSFCALAAYDDSDGSTWISTYDALQGNVLVQFSASHQELRRISLSEWAMVMAYDQAGNSFWVHHANEKRLLHLGPDGETIWQDRLMAFGYYLWLDPRDGSCWTTEGEELVRLSSEGAEIERRPLPVPSFRMYGFCISPTDGSWYVMTDSGAATPVLLHLDADGSELWRREGLGWWFAPNETDGSVWTVEGTWRLGLNDVYQALSHVYHLAADGTQLWTGEFASLFSSPTVNPADGSLWVAANDPEALRLVHLSSSGETIAEVPFGSPVEAIAAVAVSSADGSVYGTGESSQDIPQEFVGYAFRMASDGSLMWLRDGFVIPGAMALNPADGSVWVADEGSGSGGLSPGSAVVHLAGDGTELWRSGTFNSPGTIQVNPHDGSAWVSDWFNGQLVHLAAPFSPFPDVQRGHWAFYEVVACVGAGIVQGYPDGLYHPGDPVARDEMAVYISRAMAGGDAAVPTGPATATFSDVSSDYWAYEYIEYAAENGIIVGYADGSYRPAVALDRAQMAVFIARAIATPPGEEGMAGYLPPRLASFLDVPTSHWAYKYVEYIKSRDVAAGYADGRYHPESTCTRDQMAVYVARAFELAL